MSKQDFAGDASQPNPMGTAAHVFAPGLLLALSRDAFSPEAAPHGGGTPTKAQFIPCKMLSLLKQLTSSACPNLQTQSLTVSKIIAGGPANQSSGSDTGISPSSLHLLCSEDFSPVWFMRQWQRCPHALLPSRSAPPPALGKLSCAGVEDLHLLQMLFL